MIESWRRLQGFTLDVIFAALVVFNSVRLFQHEMWLDELQAFMLAAASSTPIDLFAKLKYEGHPGLWHLLLWVITVFTSDPVWMQAAHLLIAVSIWFLIWRLSPFTPLEKILLLLSYYLFWEYFVISRNYAIGVLLGFSFVALWLHRPAQRFWPFVLLGLLANTSIWGTIWSFGLAALFLFRNRAQWRTLLPGFMLYGALATLAVATMLPARDNSFASAHFFLTRKDIIGYVVSAFVPLFAPFTHDTLARFGGATSRLAQFLGDSPVNRLAKFVAESPVLVATTLVFPILICGSIVRDRLLWATYAVIAIGFILFGIVWLPWVEPRHSGFLFVSLVGIVWLWRAGQRRSVNVVWLGVLAVSAIGGLTTLSSEDRPYSQSRHAALWLEQHQLHNGFIVGWPDIATSSVAAYLKRPLYHLECECLGTYIKWGPARLDLSREQFLARLSKVLMANGIDAATVVVGKQGNFNLGKSSAKEQEIEPDLEEQKVRPELVFQEIKRFQGAINNMENYTIYRVTLYRSN